MLKSKAKSIAILAIVAVLGLAAVYLIARPQGNGVDHAGNGDGLAASLGPYATGDMANFKPSETDENLPDVEFQDGQGKKLSLASFKGKLVLLNLWATWCGPCREEMPALDRLQAAHGSPNFEVVALSVDRDGLELVHKFQGEVGVKALKAYNDPTGKASFTLKAFGLPTTLLAAPDGRILGRLVGPAVWDGKAAAALVEAAQKLPD